MSQPIPQQALEAAIYIVPTPIGNLGDITARALAVLESAAFIFAEDTRHSKKLLQYFGIQTPLRSFHEHSASTEVERMVTMVQQGQALALISDAGTPLVSDPGFQLVQKMQQAGLRVVPLPGACAAVTALSASGLPCDRFMFEGFLPAKQSARQQRLLALQDFPHTIICYEAPQRILATLQDCCAVLGETRQACLARELSKQFETVYRASLGELLAFVVADENQQRGEIVLLLAGMEKAGKDVVSGEDEKVLKLLLDELSVKQAAALAAKITGKGKRALYNRALTLKK